MYLKGNLVAALLCGALSACGKPDASAVDRAPSNDQQPSSVAMASQYTFKTGLALNDEVRGHFDRRLLAMGRFRPSLKHPVFTYSADNADDSGYYTYQYVKDGVVWSVAVSGDRGPLWERLDALAFVPLDTWNKFVNAHERGPTVLELTPASFQDYVQVGADGKLVYHGHYFN